MLKREIKYTDFNDEVVIETFYFNLTKSELVDMEMKEDGMAEYLQRIIKAEDKNAVLQEFKKWILDSYGVKSEDGKRFVKSEAMREAFAQTAAYDTLFMELVMDDNKAAEFMQGILPTGLVESLEDPNVALVAQAASAPALPITIDTSAPTFPPAPPAFTVPPQV